MKTATKERATKLSALDAFYANPTPENAVRLAIDDHRAGLMVDHEFICQLNIAADLLRGLK